MFAFTGGAQFFAAEDCADRWCAQQETRPEDAAAFSASARHSWLTNDDCSIY
jgi:hypothetical protein